MSKPCLLRRGRLNRQTWPRNTLFTRLSSLSDTTHNDTYFFIILFCNLPQGLFLARNLTGGFIKDIHTCQARLFLPQGVSLSWPAASSRPHRRISRIWAWGSQTSCHFLPPSGQSRSWPRLYEPQCVQNESWCSYVFADSGGRSLRKERAEARRGRRRGRPNSFGTRENLFLAVRVATAGTSFTYQPPLSLAPVATLT